MKYWSYGSLVVPVDESASYKRIVALVRLKVGRNIMWEDIKECDIEDYIDYLEESLQRANNEVERLRSIVIRKADCEDIDLLYRD